MQAAHFGAGGVTIPRHCREKTDLHLSGASVSVADGAFRYVPSITGFWTAGFDLSARGVLFAADAPRYVHQRLSKRRGNI